MHACLEIGEVLYLIFEEASRGTLAALAVTCRAFKEPALSTLWRELYSFVPLLLTMSADLWEIRQTEGVEYTLVSLDLTSRRTNDPYFASGFC